MIKLHTAVDQVDTTAKFALGTRTQDAKSNEYVYVRGVSGGSAYACVSVDEAGYSSLALSTSDVTLIGTIGFLQAAVDSTSEYGWALVKGYGTALAGGAITDNTKLQPASNQGYIDDTTTGTSACVGLWARGSATAVGDKVTIQLDYPKIINVAWT